MNVKDVIAEVSKNGKIFRVSFVRRTDSKTRKMVCRKGVKVALHGGDQAYNSKDYNLEVVYDMQIHAYRSIPLENVFEIIGGGKIYRYPDFVAALQ